MRAVITVIGKDTVGILAKVTGICAKYNVNVTDVSQTIMQELFAMNMLADIDGLTAPYGAFADEMGALGDELGLKVHVMHEDIFNSMHRI
ncbi:MAG: ACT domain-containing protein [Oscillospiraceae bacterium]|jgi:ACT domain-containing protein|nr:ACT domain-containing protein [Oscillospiraceae bacterium]